MHWRIRLGYRFPGGKYFYEHRGFGHLAQQLQRFTPDDAEERCGVLVGVPFASIPISFREVPNNHGEPAEHFRVMRRDWEAVRSSVGPRRSVLGVLHTHPGRDREGWFPSASDLAGAAKQPDLIHLTYHPYTRRLTYYGERGIGFTLHIR